jgi:tRNA(Glu) U13 pseudouridine synthase TruD
MLTVTEETLSNYTLDDVIFPVIGHKVKMPENAEMKKLIQEIMAKDKVTMEMFENHASIGITSATGSYRKIIGRA